MVMQKGIEPDGADGEIYWRRVTLDSVIDLRLSSVDKKSKANEHAVRLCNYTDVYNNSFIHADMNFMAATATDREIAKCSLVAGDVVITKDSEKYDDIGVPALVREAVPDLVCGYHLAILRPHSSEVDGAYLFYALSAIDAQQQFHSYANGVTRFGLRKADIGLVEIPKPPLPEQRAIAHILGMLDDKIELNRRMNDTLEEMARALFKSWFVDFDPVRAKMEGRWRRGQSLPGMPAELYDLFPDGMVSSELGEIPEGWEVKALGELFVAKNVRVGNIDVPEYSCTIEGVIPRSGRFKKRLSLSKAKNKVISKGDFVFGLSRRVLNFGLMRDDIGCVSPAYRTYSTNQNLVIPDLLERIMRLQSEYFYLAVSSSSREGQSISQEALYGLQVTLPAIAIQLRLYQTIERISLRAVHGLMENHNLGSLRDVLLPKLIAGEVKIDSSTFS